MPPTPLPLSFEDNFPIDHKGDARPLLTLGGSTKTFLLLLELYKFRYKFSTYGVKDASGIATRSAMAFTLPIPAPPGTPTPPPEDQPGGEHVLGLGLDGFLNSPARSTFDPSSLSPLDQTFQAERYGSMKPSPNPVNSADASSSHGRISTDSPGGQSGTMMEDGKGVFQFQPTTLAKSPVSKSVSMSLTWFDA